MGQFLATVRPRIDTAIATAYAQHDLLFDWHRFEIPKGGACLKSMNIIMPGTNGTAGNEVDFTYFIAKSVNGGAPSSLGTANAAMNNAAGKIAFAGCKNHIIYTQAINADVMTSPSTYTQSYTIYTQTSMNTINTAPAAYLANALQPGGVALTNEDHYDGTSSGYQSLWIAAITNGAQDFGTNIALNQAGDQAAVALSAASETTLTVDTQDADDILSVGDELIADDGAKIGKVTEVVSATSIKVDHVEEALEDDDAICVRNPIIFNLGIEY